MFIPKLCRPASVHAYLHCVSGIPKQFLFCVGKSHPDSSLIVLIWTKLKLALYDYVLFIILFFELIHRLLTVFKSYPKIIFLIVNLPSLPE